LADGNSGRAKWNANRPRPHARRWLKWTAAGFAGLALLLGALGLGLYIERARVAATIAQHVLAQYGIESEVAFGRFNWGGFLARVRAGPPDKPDFTAERMEATLVYPGSGLIGSVTPRVAAIRLVHPLLRGSYDGKEISFGSLQALLHGGKASRAGGPLPDLAIEGGRLILSTPDGTLDVIADLSLRQGRLRHLQARLEPGTFTTGGVIAKLSGGTATLDATDADYRAALTLKADSVGFGGMQATGVGLDSTFAVQWRTVAGGTVFSLAGLKAMLHAARAGGGQASLGAANTQFTLPSIEASYANGRLHAAMRGETRWDATGLKVGALTLEAAGAEATISSLVVDIANGAWSAAAAARTTLDGRGAAYPAMGETARLAVFKADLGGSGTLASNGASGALKGTLTADGSLPRGIAVRTLRIDCDGSGAFDDSASTGRLRLSLAAKADVPPATARELARAIPGVSGDGEIDAALSDAMTTMTVRLRNLALVQGVEGLTVSAPSPLTVAGAHGASATLRAQSGRALADTYGKDVSGAFALDIDGGALPQLHLTVSAYRYRGGANPRTRAETQFRTALDFGPLRGLKLSGAGNLQVTRAGTSFIATDCAHAGFDSFRRNGAAVLSNVAAELCGDAKGPLIALSSSGWQLQGTLTNASARIEAGSTTIQNAGGEMKLSGGQAQIRSAAIAIEKARIADTLPAKRFQPIDARGTLTASGSDWHGVIKLAAGAYPLGTVTIHHSLATGAGDADIDARGIRFAPNGLQPANLAPFLSAIGRRVAGRADFTGRVAWSAAGITSSGNLALVDVGFQSRLGTAQALSARLALRSLVPVALEPGQTLTIRQIDAFVPLREISARFSYAPDALQLDSASASIADGHIALDPMRYSLSPGATNMGTLHLDDVDVTPLIAAAGLAGRVSATAHIAGAIPFTIGPDGVRFKSGHVAATGPGRLSIKRAALDSSVGVAGAAATTPNAVQDFAYQALENLAFDQLEGTVNSQPMGRLGLLLHIKGRHDPAEAAEPRVGLFALLQGHAFDKPLPLPKGTPIDLTLDTSLNLDELLNSYFNAAKSATAAAATN
jgi:Dicarboxylate transport